MELGKTSSLLKKFRPLEALVLQKQRVVKKNDTQVEGGILVPAISL